MALVTTVAIASVQLLAINGEQLLDEVAVDIENPRPYENVVIETPLVAPPVWASTTVPPSILTWVERPVSTTGGCLSQAGVNLGLVTCGAGSETLLNGLSDDGEIVRISLVDESECVTGDNTGPSPVVSMQPCGSAGQGWREVSSSGATATYEHEDSGLCLQSVVPATPSALTMATCDGSAEQILEVIF